MVFIYLCGFLFNRFWKWCWLIFLKHFLRTFLPSTRIFYGFVFWPFIKLFLDESSSTMQLYSLWKSFSIQHNDSINTFRTDIRKRGAFYKVYAILVHVLVCLFFLNFNLRVCVDNLISKLETEKAFRTQR